MATKQGGSSKLTGGGGTPVKTTQYFTGKPAEKIGVGGAAQFGASIGTHVSGGLGGGGRETGYRGDPWRMGAMPNRELGNECAVRTVAGPGGSRTISPTGGQGQHGPVEGRVKPQGADILREFGSESPTSAERMRRGK
jgi:hypothetical protein